MPFVLLFWGRQFFYFVFGLLLLDSNYIAFGEATLCYRILHAFGMDNAVGFFAFGEAIHLNLLLLVKRRGVGTWGGRPPKFCQVPFFR
jgi:hypothetical protein